MGINLSKGSKFNLTKKEPALKKAMLGLGWEVSDETMDLDVSLFMLAENGKIPKDEYFVFYNNLKSPDGSVQHTGDNRDGKNDGDDELILVNLESINRNVTELLVVVTIHDANGKTFNDVKNSYVRLMNVETDKEVVRYDIKEESGNYNSLEFCKIVINENNEWEFVAIGHATNDGLEGFVNKYA